MPPIVTARTNAGTRPAPSRPITDRVDVSDDLVAAVVEAADIMLGRRAPSRVHLPPGAVDVRAIRARLRLSQPQFAARFGFALATLRDWEQGRRRPEQAARTLLLVIDRTPSAVTDALAAASQTLTAPWISQRS
jgi:putative transcriptional regulator